MNDFLSELMRKDDLIPIIAVIGGLTIAAVWIVMATVQAMVVATAKEKTKQELAAYVAEGTMDADKAVAILNAGVSASEEDAKAVVMMTSGKCA